MRPPRFPFSLGIAALSLTLGCHERVYDPERIPATCTITRQWDSSYDIPIGDSKVTLTSYYSALDCGMLGAHQIDNWTLYDSLAPGDKVQVQFRTGRRIDRDGKETPLIEIDAWSR